MSSSVNISRQSGFTLIEMTLASALTVFLTLVMVMAYQANQQSSQYQTAINTMQNSARYVAQTMIERLTFADLAPGENDYVTVYGDNTELAATDSVTVEYTGMFFKARVSARRCNFVMASAPAPSLNCYRRRSAWRCEPPSALLPANTVARAHCIVPRRKPPRRHWVLKVGNLWMRSSTCACCMA